MRRWMKEIAFAAALSVGSCNVWAAPATWKVVDLHEVDVQCYGYWWAAQSHSEDRGERREANGFTTALVQHYTIPVWWKRARWPDSVHVPDISETAYYSFQQSVADQFGKQAFAFFDRWRLDWSGRRSGDWKAENVRCRLRDADIMRERKALENCIEDMHCTMTQDRIA